MTEYFPNTMKKIDYITREAAKEAFCVYMGLTSMRAAVAADYIFDKIPAADVRPVVRAHWIETAPINEETMKPLIVKGPHLKCSNCGIIEFQRNYCPNCGADMEGIIYNNEDK